MATARVCVDDDSISLFINGTFVPPAKPYSGSGSFTITRTLGNVTVNAKAPSVPGTVVFTITENGNTVKRSRSLSRVARCPE